MSKIANFPSSFFFNNRKNVFSMMANNSIMFILSGIDKKKSGDINYKFRQDSNFFYLTGLSCKRSVLALLKTNDKTSTYLFDYYIKSSKLQNEELHRAKIEYIESHEELINFYNHVFIGLNISNTYLYNEFFADSIIPTYTQVFAENLKRRFSFINLKAANKIMTKLRIIKQPIEIKMIKKATSVTKDALEDLSKNLRHGICESECEAILSYNYLKRGTFQEAFTPTVAIGKNSLILDYEANTSKAKKNDLILIDTGSAYNNYATDISRTYPIKGKFTASQKRFYDIVLKFHNEILTNIRPNASFDDLEKVCNKFLYKALKKLRLIKNSNDIKKYFPHRIGHFVGLDVHDLGTQDTKFKPGMVIAIEPALYIQEQSIGIRIENVILITKSGYEIISKNIPYKTNEIEMYLNKEK